MQIFILIPGCLHSIAMGFMVAFPAVLNPAILSPNSTDITATSAQASWIASTNGISGIFGFLIFSHIFQSFGRKMTGIGLNVILIVGWLTLSLANSITVLVFARAIQGLSIGGVFISSITICEYASPRRRGYFTTIKIISVGVGSLLCHSFAIFCTWRQIAAFCIIPTALAVIFILFWPESPSFLAMKGRFEDCEKAFTWLNGNSVESKRELKYLIKAQMRRHELIRKTEKISIVECFIKTLKNKEMQKACIISALLTLCIDSCGRYFLIAYITQILVEITGSKSIAIYCSIVSDLLLIFGLSISCIVIRKFKRRKLLFSLGTLTIAIMFIISIVAVLKSKYDILCQVPWLFPFVVLLHTFVAHIGLVPVSFAITAEVYPLEYKGICSCISGIVFTIFYALTLKLTPVMIEFIGVSGTYAVYALLVMFCLAILYFILPETKDKTLQEIEDEIRGIDRSDADKNLLPEKAISVDT
ncbi:unnamed protein product [Parnassius mnemosyne]|uniref:Major facilitator superfamily (MFS) profile domain-containing protein n=1 Tax=Parnassius mnemosyne TaxID=213953 RepID=A0AAV1LN70_9NEOP